jgi:hypothetical protein
MTTGRDATRPVAAFVGKDDGHPRAQFRTGGRAVGGQVIGRRRAMTTTGCQCCGCRIGPGELVFEMLTDSDVARVCADCLGPLAW